MLVVQGTPASKGIAFGPACIVAARKPAPISKECATDPAYELVRLQKARACAKQEIQKIYQHACTHIGKKDSIIFQIHIIMLEDESFQKAIIDSIVKDRTTAEYAVWYNGSRLYEHFSSMDDEYMRARSEDMLDICHRLLSCLNQGCCSIPNVEEYLAQPAVLCLKRALPSEVMQSKHKNILAIVSQYGSATSHSAMLARSMGLPAVIALGAAFQELKPGAELIVDGTAGQVIVEPTPEVREEYKARANEQASP